MDVFNRIRKAEPQSQSEATEARIIVNAMRVYGIGEIIATIMASTHGHSD